MNGGVCGCGVVSFYAWLQLLTGNDLLDLEAVSATESLEHRRQELIHESGLKSRNKRFHSVQHNKLNLDESTTLAIKSQF